jgi:subtilisin family serine protease
MSDEPTFGGVTHRAHAPGQIVLRVREEAIRPHLEAGSALSIASARRLPDSVVEPLAFLREKAGAKEVSPLFVSNRVRARATSRTTPGGKSLTADNRHRIGLMASVVESESEDLAGIAVVEVPKKAISTDVLRMVAGSPAIEWAEPMPARWLTKTTPSDSAVNRQWGLRAIRWYQATIPDAGEITVAVIDTGIDTTHPDLARLSIAYEHSGLSKLDLIGHGTHVSGIIGATTNAASGTTGVSRCKLSVYKVFDDKPADDGQFYVDGERYLRALGAVSSSGAKVLNLSLGGTASSQAEQVLFNRLRRFGVTVVAAMGNEFDQGNPTEFPAAYDNVFAVGASDETDQRSPFSNTGPHIQIVAPGTNILSTLPIRRSEFRDETAYAAWSGTSMATPHVAAAAALLTAKDPKSTPLTVSNKLVRTARKVPAMKGRARTEEYGSGLLDLQRALS